jgi:hypothetical protein
MPVLNVKSLSNRQLKQFSDGYDAVADQSLSPFPSMDGDPVRHQIDDLITRVLGLPSLTSIRSLLAREPVIANAALWSPSTTAVSEAASEQFELLLPQTAS